LPGMLGSACESPKCRPSVGPLATLSPDGCKLGPPGLKHRLLPAARLLCAHTAAAAAAQASTRSGARHLGEGPLLLAQGMRTIIRVSPQRVSSKLSLQVAARGHGLMTALSQSNCHPVRAAGWHFFAARLSPEEILALPRRAAFCDISQFRCPDCCVCLG
jgi:hypothetical protein